VARVEAMTGSICPRPMLALALSVAITLLGTIASVAEGAPPQLLGKTITASWNESAEVRADGDDKVVGGSRTTTLTIYISSQGRIFVRRHVAVSGGQRTMSENAPGESVNHFEKGALVSRTGQINGAFERIIRFSPDFQTCTVSAIAGRPQGSQRRYRSEVDGRTYTVLGPTTVANERCSIAAGNAL
jgi:hypothetical protein